MACSIKTAARILPLQVLVFDRERRGEHRTPEFPSIKESLLYLHREFQDIMRAVRDGKELPRSLVRCAMELAAMCLKVAVDLGDEAELSRIEVDVQEQLGMYLSDLRVAR